MIIKCHIKKERQRTDIVKKEKENKNKTPYIHGACKLQNQHIKQESRMEREREREYCCMMRDCTRKLALWHTRTFKPILTHEELEPILATKGFVVAARPSPSSSSSGGGLINWVEYVYAAAAATTKSEVLAPPKARLPDSRIDGLHIYTYRAFIDAVNFYLEMDDISTLFHIR